ncbi:MAG: glucose-6-phosphate isomerase [Balneolales bacterium]
MIKVDTSACHPFLSSEEREAAVEKAKRSFKALADKSGRGSEWLGWRDILSSPNDALLEQIDSVAEQIRGDGDVFIVCGIGGSYLGAKAVIDALTPFHSERKPEILYAGHNISGKYMQGLIDYLNRPNADGSEKSVYLNVISKSGTTMETALAFRTLRKWMHDTYAGGAKHRIFGTTSKEGGALNKIIDAYGYQKFIIPEDVGGRYSVLTPVGLLPIAAAGFAIRPLFYGAVEAYNEYEQKQNDVIEYAAIRYALYEKGIHIDLLASFDPALSSFGSWMQQLYGESEGKNGKGMFPAVVNYSTDLHSLGQLAQEGMRNLMETFLVVNKIPSSFPVQKEKEDFDGLNFLAGKPFHEINEKACEGTRKAHIDGNVPVCSIALDSLNEQSIGQAIYFFELAISIYVYCLEENPFDQPGVEQYKTNMRQLLVK